MCPRRRWWARWMRRTLGARRRSVPRRRQGARGARARPGDGVPRVARGLAGGPAGQGVGACAHGAVGGRGGCVAKRSEHSHVTDIVEGAADAVVLSGADRHASPVRGHRYRHPRVVDRILAVDVAANLGPRPAALRVHAHVAAVGVVLCGADGHTRAVRRHRYSPPGRVARSLAVDVAANLGPRPAALRVHAHVAGDGSRSSRRSLKRLSPRACRLRTSIPTSRTVARSLAVDVAANLGPRPAALRVHAHMTGASGAAAVVL